MKYEVSIVDTNLEENIGQCFTVFSYLRPHLDEAEFIHRVQVQAAEGYTIACIYMDDEVVAAAGYRVQHYLAWGKILYLDDLITHPQKKNAGLGSALMEWVKQQAKILNCNELHLDTGYQRHDAHRLYLNNGFDLSCHHLSKKIS
ncbi:MAG: GNAT family N-acetyltransferase [Burkholderiales bacterium]|nr:GNAT family N-acetyltransferase [Burkholderiales bacterium]MBI3729195.1 GNAT family N-acetyltransferase [Burkholderiales bacterium]